MILTNMKAFNNYSKLICLAFILIIITAGCRKENNRNYKAEGYVYLINSRKAVSNAPVVMIECKFSGTRCMYEFVTRTYTDSNGYYFISGKTKNGGSMSIEVGNHDSIFGTPPSPAILYPNRVLRQDFYVEQARYVTARFIVEPQNRNFALLSINSGYYSSKNEVFRNITTTIDTIIKYKYVANSPVNLKVLLQNQNPVTQVYSDSLEFFKDLGIPLKDTSLIWIVP